MTSAEAAIKAPRTPILPQWKIDLVQEAIKRLEDEMGGPVTAKVIARRMPSFSLSDIDNAIKFLKERRRTER